MFACVYVCALCVHCCRMMPEEGIVYPATGVIGDCEFPDIVSWNSNSDPLQEQQVILTSQVSF